jgi:enoyl-CoA hydratase/carnithine racemase
MTRLEEYANKYENIHIERRNGVLEMRFHSNGDSLKWCEPIHRDLGYAFTDVASDVENKVVLMTGTGDDFCADLETLPPLPTPRGWDKIYWEGKRVLMNLMDIEVPVISAVNGPARIHVEFPLVADIVLASETAVFQDAPHFPTGTVPGDGVNIIFPLLMGETRGKYFLLTGQELSATEAQALGLVNEVLPKDKLADRAWELAEQLAQKPLLTLRYTRVLLNFRLKRMLQEMLGYGLALEGLGALDLGAELSGKFEDLQKG